MPTVPAVPSGCQPERGLQRLGELKYTPSIASSPSFSALVSSYGGEEVEETPENPWDVLVRSLLFRSILFLIIEFLFSFKNSWALAGFSVGWSVVLYTERTHT